MSTSKPASIIALIAWQIVASPLLVSIESLGGSRRALLSQAIAHFSPVHIGSGGHGAAVTLSQGTALIVLAAWLAVFFALGAWHGADGRLSNYTLRCSGTQHPSSLRLKS